MIGREGPHPDLTAALDAYRAAAQAEADALFDDKALEAQRLKILARLEHAGQPARVLRFPVSARAVLPSSQVSRRWISVAAAAGLVVGLLTGQWLHLAPGDPARPRAARPAQGPPVASGLGVVPAAAASTEDEEFLGAVDAAVRLHSISELRALDDMTFAYNNEPR
jgi:hypothetical protein